MSRRTNYKPSIDSSWHRLVRLCDRALCASELQVAYDAAVASERGHRRNTGNKYRLPVDTTARWEVLRRVLHPLRPPQTWRGFLGLASHIAACGVVADILHATQAHRLDEIRGEWGNIDYVDDIAVGK